MPELATAGAISSLVGGAGSLAKTFMGGGAPSPDYTGSMIQSQNDANMAANQAAVQGQIQGAKFQDYMQGLQQDAEYKKLLAQVMETMTQPYRTAGEAARKPIGGIIEGTGDPLYNQLLSKMQNEYKTQYGDNPYTDSYTNEMTTDYNIDQDTRRKALAAQLYGQNAIQPYSMSSLPAQHYGDYGAFLSTLGSMPNSVAGWMKNSSQPGTNWLNAGPMLFNAGNKLQEWAAGNQAKTDAENARNSYDMWNYQQQAPYDYQPDYSGQGTSDWQFGG